MTIYVYSYRRSRSVEESKRNSKVSFVCRCVVCLGHNRNARNFVIGRFVKGGHRLPRTYVISNWGHENAFFFFHQMLNLTPTLPVFFLSRCILQSQIKFQGNMIDIVGREASEFMRCESRSTLELPPGWPINNK